MKTKRIAWLLALLMLLLPLSGCSGNGEEKTDENEIVLYVAPDGDDTAKGTKKAPLATLAGAREKVRELLPKADRPVTVLFAEGDYLMTETVAFDEADSGKEGMPVTYKAEDGAKVRFAGGINVPAELITKADPEAAVTGKVTDEAAAAALLQADLSSLIGEYPEIYHVENTEENTYQRVGQWNPMRLILGETPLTYARWPNEGVRGEKDYCDFVREEGWGPVGETKNFFVDDETAEHTLKWSDDSVTDAYVSGFLRVPSDGYRCRILEIDRDENRVLLSPSSHLYSHGENGGGGPTGYFYNIPEEIDVPGEGYVDRGARIAYFYPTEDFDENELWLTTMTDKMVTFDGTSHIVIEGIEFCYSSAAVLYSHNAVDFTLRDCRAVHLGARAVYFFEAKDLLIDGCEFGDDEHGGLYVSGGDRRTLEPANVVIENCEFYHLVDDDFPMVPFEGEQTEYGRYDTENLNAITTYAVGTVIRHCYFHDMNSTAILPVTNDVIIEYNIFEKCNTKTADMGVIYYNCDPSMLGITIRYNYFHDIGNLDPHCQLSIYEDCGAFGAEIYGNLFISAGGIDLKGLDNPRGPKGVLSISQFTHVHNNVFVDAAAIFRYADWTAGSGRTQSDWILYMYGKSQRYDGSAVPGFFREVDYESDTWHEKYDGTIWGNIYKYFSYELLKEMEACDDYNLCKRKACAIAPSKTNELENNVLVDILTLVNDDYAKSINSHDNFEGDLSIFTDPANGDYSLTAEGLARVREVCPDFEELPISEMGIRK